MNVRRITPDQYELHRQIRLTALLDAPSAFATKYQDADARTEEQWKEMTTNCSAGTEGSMFFAYDENSNAVGMVGGFRDKNDRDAVHMVAMWVAPDARGSGAANLLVEAVLTWAKSIPVKRVIVATTAGNDRALRLYQRMGFAEPTGASPHVPHADSCDTVWVQEL